MSWAIMKAREGYCGVSTFQGLSLPTTLPKPCLYKQRGHYTQGSTAPDGHHPNQGTSVPSPPRLPQPLLLTAIPIF